MKSFSYILSAFIFLFSTYAFGIAAAPRTPNLNGHNNEDCAMKSQNGGTGNLQEVNCMLNPESCLHDASWYQDRDNSMSDANDEVAEAMVVIDSKAGFTQGVQVCEGVYLATAHGALDNPDDAKKEGRALRTPNDSMKYIDPYPMSDDTYLEVDSAQYTSPRLRDASNWSDPSTDYVFINVGQSIGSKSSIRPVTGSRSDIVDASNRGDIDIHLYRGKTRYNTDSNGTPDFNRETWIDGGKSFNELAELYSTPQRVNQRCEISQVAGGNLTGSDCPTEQAVSGSTYATEIDGKNYLVGLHARGDSNSYNSSEDDTLLNSFVNSEHFCKDYENVCGQPCANLNDLSQQRETVSL